MDEEIIRIKYRNLLNKLYRIKSKYQEIENSYDELNICIRENLLVNNKNVVEDEFYKIKDNTNLLEDKLVNDIIYTVSSRT